MLYPSVLRIPMSTCANSVSYAGAHMDSLTQGWPWCAANGTHQKAPVSKLRRSCEEADADAEGMESDEKGFMTQVSGSSTNSGASSFSLEELSSPEFFSQHCSEIDGITLRAMDTCILEEMIQTVAAGCKFCVTIADTTSPDLPLIAVSEKFEEITGYSRHEVIGKNCRFLNDGCNVDHSDLARLRLACATGAPFTSVLTNRRKSGELFLNLLDVRGLVVAHKPHTGEELWFLVGIQADITDIADHQLPCDHLPELHHVVSLIRSKITDQLTAMAVAGALMADFEVDDGRSDDAWCLLQEPRWKSDAKDAKHNVPNDKSYGATSTLHDSPTASRRCSANFGNSSHCDTGTEPVQGILAKAATSFVNQASYANAAKQRVNDAQAVSALLLGSLAAMGALLLLRSFQQRE